MAAAVSDFRPASQVRRRSGAAQGTTSLELRPPRPTYSRPSGSGIDLFGRIRGDSQGPVADARELSRKGANLVVGNDISEKA